MRPRLVLAASALVLAYLLTGCAVHVVGDASLFQRPGGDAVARRLAREERARELHCAGKADSDVEEALRADHADAAEAKEIAALAAGTPCATVIRIQGVGR